MPIGLGDASEHLRQGQFALPFALYHHLAFWRFNYRPLAQAEGGFCALPPAMMPPRFLRVIHFSAMSDGKDQDDQLKVPDLVQDAPIPGPV